MSDAVIDTLDIVILGAVLVGSGIYWFKDKLLSGSSRTSAKQPLVPLQKPNAPALKINKVAKKTRDFVQKMKETASITTALSDRRPEYCFKLNGDSHCTHPTRFGCENGCGEQTGGGDTSVREQVQGKDGNPGTLITPLPLSLPTRRSANRPDTRVTLQTGGMSSYPGLFCSQTQAMIRVCAMIH